MLHCSCFFAHICKSFEFWSECVEEVEIFVVAEFTAATDGASRRAGPFKPIGVDDVVSVASILL